MSLKVYKHLTKTNYADISNKIKNFRKATKKKLQEKKPRRASLD